MLKTRSIFSPPAVAPLVPVAPLAVFALEQLLEARYIHVPFERSFRDGIERLRHGQVERDAVAHLDVGARRVEVRVVRDRLAGAGDLAQQDLLGGAALVGRDQVLEREQLGHRVAEAEPGRGPGVALVAVLNGGPLVAAHRARA